MSEHISNTRMTKLIDKGDVGKIHDSRSRFSSSAIDAFSSLDIRTKTGWCWMNFMSRSCLLLKPTHSSNHATWKSGVANLLTMNTMITS